MNRSGIRVAYPELLDDHPAIFGQVAQRRHQELQARVPAGGIHNRMIELLILR